MDCDWIFLSKDAREEVTLNEKVLPSLKDGKNYNGTGYEVQLVVTNRIGDKNPLVLAVRFN